MSGINKTRSLFQHEQCKCKCALNGSVCNSKKFQKWNYDKFGAECKKLDDAGSCKLYVES